MSEKPFLFNYGWDHFWYDPVDVKNLAVREFVRGPFAKHKLVCSIPFVTRCQRDGTPVELREGIPDCWAEYLTRKSGFFRKHLRNYELMHKENADVVSHLRKYRLYIGQGIPDPWPAHIYNPEIFPHLKDTEHRKHSKNKKEERCLCCEREYLFECPDKCGSNVNRCSCKDCHGKNSTGSDFTDKCRCSEIFHSWILANSRRRRRRGSSGDCVSSPNGSHSGTDDEGGDSKGLNKFVGFCECSGSDTSGLGGGDHEPYVKTRKFCHKNDIKHHSKVYFCPYVKHFCRRKSPESDKSIGEPKVSKEIQTEIPAIKSSKTVQTEKPKTKAQPKCTCRSKCFPCNVLCSRSWVKSGCPAVHSIPNYCCSHVFTQRPTFVCPYSFANHLPVDKCFNNETGEIKKRHKKKKQVKEKDSDEGSNADLKFDQPEARVDRDGPVPKSKPKEDLHETTESLDHLKCYKNVYNSQTPSTTLDHMKFLANYKLKGYLHQEESSPGVTSNKFLHQSSSTGSKYKNFFSGNSSSNNLKQEESPLERCKPFSSYRYSDLTFHDSKMNMRQSNFLNGRRFSYCDQATMTPLKEAENHKSNVSVTKESVHKEMIEGNETKACALLRNHEVTRILGKRRKLLRNRRRRKKLVTSILAHQDASTKPPKQTSNAKNEVQVEGFSQDNTNVQDDILKRYSSRNFTSPSDHLNASENTDLRYTDTILNSRYKQEVLKKHLGMLSSWQDQKNSVTCKF